MTCNYVKDLYEKIMWVLNPNYLPTVERNIKKKKKSKKKVQMFFAPDLDFLLMTVVTVSINIIYW